MSPKLTSSELGAPVDGGQLDIQSTKREAEDVCDEEDRKAAAKRQRVDDEPVKEGS